MMLTLSFLLPCPERKYVEENEAIVLLSTVTPGLPCSSHPTFGHHYHAFCSCWAHVESKYWSTREDNDWWPWGDWLTQELLAEFPGHMWIHCVSHEGFNLKAVWVLNQGLPLNGAHSLWRKQAMEPGPLWHCRASSGPTQWCGHLRQGPLPR